MAVAFVIPYAVIYFQMFEVMGELEVIRFIDCEWQ
jgi:hypothetical protein